MAELRTIRGVEIVRAGTWQSSTGEWTVTPADLAAAVQAHNAGVLRRPVLKIGHTDPRFDGSPALGRLDNLRLADNGRTLVADLVDVPKAVAALLPNAYPDRSVEALRDYQAPDGRVWPLVITALALLGETRPAVDTLAEIGDLYGIAASAARVTLAAKQFQPESPADRQRQRAVAVAAARRRRHRYTIGD